MAKFAAKQREKARRLLKAIDEARVAIRMEKAARRRRDGVKNATMRAFLARVSLNFADESKCTENFRISLSTLHLLEHVMAAKKRQLPNMKVTSRVAIALFLNYVTQGISMRSLSQHTGFSKSSVSKHIDLCISVLFPAVKHLVQTPGSAPEWRFVQVGFAAAGFLPVLGCLDGKHVYISCPKKSGSIYYNYKKRFSINLMAMVDSQSRFLHFDVGYPGSRNDATCFAKGTLKEILSGSSLPPSFFLPGSNVAMNPFVAADGGFALSNTMMKPFAGEALTEAELVFNAKFSGTRVKVEHAFGLLTTRFRILNRALDLPPEKAARLVAILCSLHNTCIEINPHVVVLRDAPNPQFADAKKMREKLVEYSNKS